jgi:hypothetical protein
MFPKEKPIFGGAAAAVAICASLGVLAANWFVAIGRYQTNVLYWDQWGFFTAIMEGQGTWGLFHWQHGPHRQGLAFVITSALMSIARWDARIDSTWIACTLILSATLALLLRRRLSGPLRVGDTWIVLAVLALGQCDSVITTPNASHSVFPLFLTLVLVHLWLSERLLVRYVASACCTFFLEFTGFGLFAAAVSMACISYAAFAELRQGRRAAAMVALCSLGVCVLGWVGFSWGYVFDPAAPGYRFPWSPETDYVKFVILMVTAPAGWEGATAFHYAIGILMLTALLAATVWAVRGFLMERALNSRRAAVLLLAASSLVYCAETAVGRIQFGVSGGLTSRYVTLVIPALVAVYLWIGAVGSRWRWLVYALLWFLVAVPYLSLAGRPLVDWPGSLGESTWMFERTQRIASQKIAFVTAYLSGENIRQIAAKQHALVFPEDHLDYIEPRLEFQKAHRLSFFADADTAFGYGPWLFPGTFQWLSGYGPEGSVRWIGDQAEVEIATRKRGYLNLRIDHALPGLKGDARLEVLDGVKRMQIDSVQGKSGVSLEIGAGIHRITLRSTRGSILPGNGDTRTLSFLIEDPFLSTRPVFKQVQMGDPIWSQGAHEP